MRDIDYSKLPNHMQDGTRLYIERGIPPGGFLTAVICNDLFLAIGRADDINRHCLFDWCAFFYSEAPPGCYGSPDTMKAWVERGGLAGNPEPAAAE